MCSQQQVSNVDVWWGQNHIPMACQTWFCMLYRHRVFIVLQIFHYPIWYLVKNDNFYLTPFLQTFLHTDRKMKILVTELFHVTF